MRYGTVIKYFPDKSYGFIRPDAGRDIFFHISVVEAANTPPEVKVGQPVGYELAPRNEGNRQLSDTEKDADKSRPKGPTASLVKLLDKLPGGSLEDIDPPKTLHHARARRRKPDWRR